MLGGVRHSKKMFKKFQFLLKSLKLQGKREN
jgi:hypothetical protein